MDNSGHWFCVVLSTLIVGVLSSSCADTGGNLRPRPQLTSCPAGLILICESRYPPSKGGPDEEIPQYERCRCEPDNQ